MAISSSVAAWRLVKERQARVLLLERGPTKASGLSAFSSAIPFAVNNPTARDLTSICAG